MDNAPRPQPAPEDLAKSFIWVADLLAEISSSLTTAAGTLAGVPRLAADRADMQRRLLEERDRSKQLQLLAIKNHRLFRQATFALEQLREKSNKRWHRRRHVPLRRGGRRTEDK